MPATIPTTAPLISLVTFSVTSALASSISSRTSSERRLGDVLDRLAELGGVGVGSPCQSKIRLRMRATRNAPAKARADEHLAGAGRPVGSLSAPPGCRRRRRPATCRCGVGSSRARRVLALPLRPRRAAARPSRAARAPCGRASRPPRSPASASAARPSRGSSSARRASVSATFSRSSAPRASDCRLVGCPRSLRRIFPEDAAPNHGREPAWSRSRPARRCPASRPDQTSRLTRSLSVMARSLWRDAQASRPSQIVSTT